MKKCYAYTWVSTTKQGEGASLEAQREAIERYAAQKNLFVSRWFEETETAAKTGRPVFSKIIKDLKRGCAKGLIVHKIDRSARNFRDWALIGDLSDLGIDIHFATESLDFNSRGGRLAADIQAVVAADYIRNLREEAKKGLNMRLEQGLYPFNAPLGYLNNGKGKPKTICPTKGPLVRTMFELCASGEYSLNSLPDEMNRRGLTTTKGGKIYKSRVEKLLRNPFYTGLIKIERTGKTYQGVHEPLVSMALFYNVQRLRRARDNHKCTKHNHLFRGLVTCATCQARLIGEAQKQFVYYRCHNKRCPRVSIREDKIETAIAGIFSRVRLRPDHLDQLRAEISAFLAEKKQATRADAAELEIAKLETRLDRLLDYRLDGDIDQNLFDAKKARLLSEVQRWRDTKRHAESLGAHQDLMDRFLEWCQNLRLMYQMAQKPEKRALAKLVTSNATLDGKKLTIEPSNWVLTLDNACRVSLGAPDKSEVRTLIEQMIEDAIVLDSKMAFRMHDQ